MFSLETVCAIVVTALSLGSIPIPFFVKVSPEGGLVVMWTPVRPNFNLLDSFHQWYQLTAVM